MLYSISSIHFQKIIGNEKFIGISPIQNSPSKSKLHSPNRIAIATIKLKLVKWKNGRLYLNLNFIAKMFLLIRAFHPDYYYIFAIIIISPTDSYLLGCVYCLIYTPNN